MGDRKHERVPRLDVITNERLCGTGGGVVDSPLRTSSRVPSSRIVQLERLIDPFDLLGVSEGQDHNLEVHLCCNRIEMTSPLKESLEWSHATDLVLMCT